MKQFLLGILLFTTLFLGASHIDLLVKKGYEELCAGHIDNALEIYASIYKKTGSLQALYNVCYIKKLKGHESKRDLDEAVEILKKIVSENPEYE